MTRRDLWLLGALTALGALPRALTLWDGLFGDELFSWAIADRPSLGSAIDLVRVQEISPPLFYVFAWAASQAMDPEFGIRVPSLLASVAAIPLAGVVGARAFGSRAGLVGAALVAASPFAVYYGGEGRAYALAAFCALLSAFALLRALDTDDRRWWALVGVSAAAAVYSHYTAVFPLAAQGAWALAAHPGRWRAIVGWHGLGALLFLPWLPFVQDNQGRPILAALSPVNRSTVVAMPLRTWAGSPYLPIGTLPGHLPAAALAGAAALSAALGLRHRRLDPRAPGGLLVAIALGGPLLALIWSLAIESLWLPRNLGASLVPALLVLGAVLAAPRGRAWLATSAVGAAVLAGGTVALSTTYQRPAYDEVAALLDREAGPQVPVIERSLAQVPGPLRLHLAAWFERPHLHVQSDAADADRAWDAGVAAGRVYVVGPAQSVIGLPGATPAARRAPDPRFRLAQHRVLDGILDLEVLEYVPR